MLNFISGSWFNPVALHHMNYLPVVPNCFCPYFSQQSTASYSADKDNHRKLLLEEILQTMAYCCIYISIFVSLHHYSLIKKRVLYSNLRINWMHSYQHLSDALIVASFLVDWRYGRSNVKNYDINLEKAKRQESKKHFKHKKLYKDLKGKLKQLVW